MNPDIKTRLAELQEERDKLNYQIGFADGYAKAMNEARSIVASGEANRARFLIELGEAAKKQFST